MPCNSLVLVSFFGFFVALDPIRGLVCLVALFCLLPAHCNKKGSDELGHERTKGNPAFALCSTKNGVHRSCAAIYFMAAACGLAEALAFSLDRAANPPRLPMYVNAAAVLGLWLTTTMLVILTFDSMSLAHGYNGHADGVQTATTSKSEATSGDVETGVSSRLIEIGRAPDDM